MSKLLDIEHSASLFRVAFGMTVLLDSRNELLDPNADDLEPHPKARRLQAIADAAQTYYSRYAQDEASEDAVDHVGCTEQQHQDACALRDALKPVFGAPAATQQAQAA